VYVRREGTSRGAFIHRAPSKAESRHCHDGTGFFTGRSTRHRYIAEIFFGGLAHVIESYEFWRRTCAPRSAFRKEEACMWEGKEQQGVAFIYCMPSKAESRHSSIAMAFLRADALNMCALRASFRPVSHMG